MSFFEFFQRQKLARVSVFARELADDVAKQYPPALDKDNAKRPSINRLTRIVEGVCAKAEEFKAATPLGWLGKAKLANEFKWAMTDLGYRKDFVDLATEALVVHLSKTKG